MQGVLAYCNHSPALPACCRARADIPIGLRQSLHGRCGFSIEKSRTVPDWGGGGNRISALKGLAVHADHVGHPGGGGALFGSPVNPPATWSIFLPVIVVSLKFA